VDWSGTGVLVTGGAGFLGSRVCKRLTDLGARRVTVPRRREFDLTDARDTRRLFATARPDIVFHLAAEVGGIGANRANPGRYLYANLAMGTNVIEEARRHGTAKFVQVGTVCSYPQATAVPFREPDLWDGYPEPTNAPYGIAKKTLLVMLQAYREQYGMNGIYLIPTNLYGPGDNFDPASSHVIPALIRKCEAARLEGCPAVECWGSGRATRDFLYVDDCADAIVTAAERYDGAEPVNLGSGSDISIRDLVALVAEATGFQGEFLWDRSRPDGQPQRRIDSERAANELGFNARVGLREGLRRTVAAYREQQRLPESEHAA
jgi:GDP-L-fucose synthase